MRTLLTHYLAAIFQDRNRIRRMPRWLACLRKNICENARGARVYIPRLPLIVNRGAVELQSLSLSLSFSLSLRLIFRRSENQRRGTERSFSSVLYSNGSLHHVRYLFVSHTPAYPLFALACFLLRRTLFLFAAPRVSIPIYRFVVKEALELGVAKRGTCRKARRWFNEA